MIMCKTNMFLIAALLVILSIIPHNRANACTRVVYQGDNKMIITGRTMDWKEDPDRNSGSFDECTVIQGGRSERAAGMGISASGY